MPQEYRSYFAYAEEKLVELRKLSVLAETKQYAQTGAYQANQNLFANDRNCQNEDVKKRLAGVRGKDYI